MTDDLPTWTRGDLEPPLVLSCLETVDDVEIPVDLSSAISVRVLIGQRYPRAATTIDADPDRSEEADGLIIHRWVEGETDTRGLYQAEVEVMWPGDRPQTFGPALYKVIPDLG